MRNGIPLGYDWVSTRLSWPNPYWRASMERDMSKKGEKGKGELFDTRKNPFVGMRQTTGVAPSVQAASGLWAGVQCALGQGCAVMVGQTRDGGALCITVLDGDERHRTYCTDDGEVDAAGQALMQMYA